MKQSLPTVHCEYAKNGTTLCEILEESFRLYLLRSLAAPKNPLCKVRDARLPIAGEE